MHRSYRPGEVSAVNARVDPEQRRNADGSGDDGRDQVRVVLTGMSPALPHGIGNSGLALLLTVTGTASRKVSMLS